MSRTGSAGQDDSGLVELRQSAAAAAGTLGTDGIDIWQLRLDGARGERRAQAHRALIALLAGYLGTAPDQLTLVRAPGGKPAFDGGSPQFNLSHSRERLLVAVSRTLPLGVDIDYPRRAGAGRRGIDLTAALARHCSRREAAAVHAAPDPLLAFTRLWVRKEAVVKASGEGVLDQLHVIDVLDEQVTGAAGPLAGSWVCVDLPAPTGFIAALAFPAEVDRRPRLRQQSHR